MYGRMLIVRPAVLFKIEFIERITGDKKTQSSQTATQIASTLEQIIQSLSTQSLRLQPVEPLGEQSPKAQAQTLKTL